MIPQPPPGQGPIDPQGAFTPPPPPGASAMPPMPPGFVPPPFPPGMFPPGFMGMAPPPPRQRGFVRAIFVTLATTIFSFSLLANIYLLAFGGLLSAGGGSSTVIHEGKPDQKIAVVPVEGIIDESSASKVIQWLDTVEQDLSFKALVLKVETPGGGVTASDEIHHRLAQLKERRKIPVVVAMGGMATSGGYYVSCGADHIFAQPTTLTGNIGVLMPRFNVSELAKRWGVQENTITAPAQGFKNASSMFQPEDPKDTAYLKGIINDAYGRFTTLVTKGRKDKLKGPPADLFNGQIFTAAQAQSNGLVDKIGYLEDAYNYAAGQANLTEPHVVRFQRRPGLMEALSSRSGIGMPAGNANINLKIDATTVDELTSPRLMYLWKGQ